MRDIYPYLGVGKPAPGPMNQEVMQDLLDFLSGGKGPYWSMEDQYALEDLVFARTEPAWLQITFDLLKDLTRDYPWISWDDYTPIVFFGNAVSRYPEIGIDMLILLLNDKRYRTFALDVLLYTPKLVREPCMATLDGQQSSFTDDERETWESLILEQKADNGVE